MKKVFVLVLVGLMMVSAALAGAETLRVGMECNYAPFNWTQAEPSEFSVPIEGGAGYADGYDVQIARKIAELRLLAGEESLESAAENVLQYP